MPTPILIINHYRHEEKLKSKRSMTICSYEIKMHVFLDNQSISILIRVLLPKNAKNIKIQTGNYHILIHMTIYEQIQKSLDYIDANLFTKLTYEKAAESAFMSARSFYNYFWAVTGHTYKEYVKKRRLAEAVRILGSRGKRILDAALEIGYESHESFTRAFKIQFGVTPVAFRKSRQILKGLEKIKLVKEMYMGVIVKELSEMKVACFEGFAPGPENKAAVKMRDWMKAHGISGKPHRIFGHNIDRKGNRSDNPQNEGYKFMAAVGSVKGGRS
jgi:AraC family transcriptional regulator